MKHDDKNSKPLEEFFQRKVWEHDISYREDDWKKLEEKLDAADAAIASRRWKYLAAAVLALVLGVLAYFTYENNIQLNRLNGQMNEQQATRTPKDESRTPHPDLAENDTPTGTLNEDSKNKKNNAARNDGASGETITKGAEEGKVKAPVQEKRLINETPSLFVAQLNCTGCPVSSFVTPSTLQTSSMVENAAVHPGLITMNSNATGNNPAAQSGSGFKASVAFVLAPDLSTAGSLSNFDNPGYKIGVTAQVQLFPRLSISTGIIHSNVYYRAPGSAYKPPDGYWPNGVVAQNTFAQCTILDIPINMKYDVLQFHHSRVFVSAGLSSYIMQSEEYRFKYATDDPQLAQQWKADTGTQHWFSNANFSVGYEWDLFQNLGLQVEPFIKIPLKEVGWGNVKLFSVGSFVSLNYKFGSK